MQKDFGAKNSNCQYQKFFEHKIDFYHSVKAKSGNCVEFLNALLHLHV